MKLLVAILVFLLAVPPVQGGYCDMGDMGGMDTANGAGPHATMHHGADVDGSGHDRARGDGAGHACCAPAGQGGQPDSGSGCADMPCGSCSLGVQAVTFVTPLAMPLPASRQAILSEGRLSPSHASPPYRPPTPIS